MEPGKRVVQWEGGLRIHSSKEAEGREQKYEPDWYYEKHLRGEKRVQRQEFKTGCRRGRTAQTELLCKYQGKGEKKGVRSTVFHGGEKERMQNIGGLGLGLWKPGEEGSLGALYLGLWRKKTNTG